MKRIPSAALFIACLSIATTTRATDYQWTNGTADNDFGNFNNWSGPPTTFFGHNFYVNLNGANKAIISADLDPSISSVSRIRLGTTTSQSGELLVSGGTTVLNTGQLQVGSTAIGLMTMTGGTFSVNGSYVTISQSAGSNGTLIIEGGTFNADRITVANVLGTTGTLTITGGAINVSNTASTSTSGSLRMNSGNAAINIGGTALVTCEVLITGNTETTPGTGLLTMSGGTLNLTGSTLATPLPTLTFADGGEVAFEGGTWIVKGDETANIAQAIADGKMHHSLGNSLIKVSYDSGSDTTIVRLYTALEVWRIAYFGSAENSGNGANDADSDNDTLKNLIEYGFDANPTAADAINLPTPVIAGGNATYTFTEPAGVSGITYGMLYSTDLIDWEPVTDTGSGDTHTFVIPVGPEGRGFVKFTVTEN